MGIIGTGLGRGGGSGDDRASIHLALARHAVRL